MSWYRKSTRHLRHSLQSLRIPRAMTLGFYWSVVAFPVHWIAGNWRKRRTRDLFLGLPAILGMISVPLIIAKTQVHEQYLSAAYLADGQDALKQKDYVRSEMLLTRVLQRHDATFSDAQYVMAVLLDETGQQARAEKLFRILAPDDSRGNRDAHRRLAMILAQKTTWQSSPLEISRLYWHLTAAGSNTSPEFLMAWGRYSLAIKDMNAARKYFEQAANTFPELWQALGLIDAALGHEDTARLNFQRSAEYHSEKLQADPKNESIRVDYAQVLMNLGRLNDAKDVLEQGRLLNPEGKWSSLLASLSVSYHDLNAEQGKPVAEMLGYLDKALTYDSNHGPALTRLMAYAKADVKGNNDLRAVLSRVIAEGQQPALAHLAMGNLCWMEGDRKAALFHFERALDIRDDAPALLNNLAWLISHDPEAPDLERAIALVNSALEKNPDNPSFLDTRGTIYFLKKDWNLALVDLEKALSGVRDKSAVHSKLATIYKELGMSEIAEQHEKLVQELKEQPVIPGK